MIIAYLLHTMFAGIRPFKIKKNILSTYQTHHFHIAPVNVIQAQFITQFQLDGHHAGFMQ